MAGFAGELAGCKGGWVAGEDMGAVLVGTAGRQCVVLCQSAGRRL
jgi:hypothetical protein